MNLLRTKIKEKSSLVAILESLVVMVILLSLCQGCVTRQRINANLWYGIAIPEDLCDTNQEIKSYGLYRKLNNGQFEFVSICSDEFENFFSIQKDDLERLLNEAGIKR